MQSAGDLNEYEKSWVDFLHYLDRAWNKLGKHAHAGGSVQKYLSEVNRLRKDDELLPHRLPHFLSWGFGIEPIFGAGVPGFNVLLMINFPINEQLLH